MPLYRFRDARHFRYIDTGTDNHLLNVSTAIAADLHDRSTAPQSPEPQPSTDGFLWARFHQYAAHHSHAPPANPKPSCGDNENKLALHTCKQCETVRPAQSNCASQPRIPQSAYSPHSYENCHSAKQYWENLAEPSCDARPTPSSTRIEFRQQAASSARIPD